jgi:DNA-binding XRE family transcriptional regulator
MPNSNSRTEIGARLVLTRIALDYTQATMAGLMGVDGQTLAAYEAGRRRIPIKQALKLCPYAIRSMDLPGADGQPTPAHPRQNSPARKLRVGRARRWADAAGSNVGYRLGKQGGLADLTPEPGAGGARRCSRASAANPPTERRAALLVSSSAWDPHKNLAENNQSSCAAGSRRRLPSVARCSW